MRGSFYDDTESNHNGKSETFPRVMPNIKTNRASQKGETIMSNSASRESICPMARPRTKPIQRKESDLKPQKDTFPESEIPSVDHVEEEEVDDEDTAESDNSGVTFEKIARHFANRPETFSESLQAHHGSWKKKDRAHYENVDLTLNEMRKS